MHAHVPSCCSSSLSQCPYLSEVITWRRCVCALLCACPCLHLHVYTSLPQVCTHRASLRRELDASPCCWPDSTVTQPVSVVCARVCYSFGFIMWTSWVTIPLQVKVHHHYWFYQSHTAELWSIFPGRTCQYYTGWTHPLHTVRSSLI